CRASAPSSRRARAGAPRGPRSSQRLRHVHERELPPRAPVAGALLPRLRVPEGGVVRGEAVLPDAVQVQRIEAGIAGAALRLRDEQRADAAGLRLPRDGDKAELSGRVLQPQDPVRDRASLELTDDHLRVRACVRERGARLRAVRARVAEQPPVDGRVGGVDQRHERGHVARRREPEAHRGARGGVRRPRRAYNSACLERALWHCRFTATGSEVMCVGYVSMLTASAVFEPPTAWGPTPSAFTFSSSSRSNCAVSSSGLCSPTGRVIAFLARYIAYSDEPPTPTPTTRGGQGLPPDSSIVCSTNSVMPSLPRPGSITWNFVMFSQPPPFGTTVRRSLSPGTISVWITAGVLFFVLTRAENGRSTIDARR